MANTEQDAALRLGHGLTHPPRQGTGSKHARRGCAAQAGGAVLEAKQLFSHPKRWSPGMPGAELALSGCPGQKHLVSLLGNLWAKNCLQPSIQHPKTPQQPAATGPNV